MKTIEEFFKEIEESEALQSELEAVKDKDALTALLNKHDVGATAEEFAKALKAALDGEISDDAAEAAAGGGIATFCEKLSKFKIAAAFVSLVE